MRRIIWVPLMLLAIAALLGYALVMNGAKAGTERSTFTLSEELQVRDLFPGGRMAPDRTYYARCLNGQLWRLYPAPDYSIQNTGRLCWQ